MNEWNTFLDSLESRLGKGIVQKWLRSLKIIDFDACNLYLEAKDSFQILWFEEHVRDIIKREFRNHNHRPIKVHVTSPDNPKTPSLEKGRRFQKSQAKGEVHKPAPTFASDPLDPFCTLDTLLVSPKNALPYQCIKKLTGPTEGSISLGMFNPIYFCGKGSIGKTHILMALTSHFRSKGMSVHFVHMQTFTDHVIEAIRHGNMQAFRSRYRHVDALIVDDVHLLARRTATQEEFFHTFNALHSEKKQIILASHLTPGELDDIEPRLVSRFEWGLVFPLAPIEADQRKAFVTTRAAHSNLALSDEIVYFLLDSFQSMKSLQMATDALLVRSEEETIDSLDLVKTRLHDLVQGEAKRSITPEIIIDSVASYYNIKTEDVTGKAQTKECVLPRKLAMYLCRQELKLPYMTIGKLFSRDHSTVMSSIKTIQKEIQDLSAPTTKALTKIHASF